LPREPTTSSWPAESRRKRDCTAWFEEAGFRRRPAHALKQNRWPRPRGSTSTAAVARRLPTGPVAARSRRCGCARATSSDWTGGRRRPGSCPTVADAPRSTCRRLRATGGGVSSRSGSPTRRRPRCDGGSPPSLDLGDRHMPALRAVGRQPGVSSGRTGDGAAGLPLSRPPAPRGDDGAQPGLHGADRDGPGGVEEREDDAPLCGRDGPDASGGGGGGQRSGVARSRHRSHISHMRRRRWVGRVAIAILVGAVGGAVGGVVGGVVLMVLTDWV
jgi:hypothetical protein